MLFHSAKKCLNSRFASLCVPTPSPVRPATVTLLDSLSSVGNSIALLLKQNPNIKELRLYDEKRSTSELFQDLRSLDTKTKAKAYHCRNLKEAITGADVVVSAGGCRCSVGQSEQDLFDKNADSIRNAAIFLSEFNPKAIFCIAKPPVEALVPLASEEYKKAELYDPGKVIGITTPVSMIVNSYIAQQFNRNPGEVLCPVIGGMSPMCAVPVASQVRPNLDINQAFYDKLLENVANAEDDLLKKGTQFCYSQAVAVCRFINLILKARKGQKAAECAFVAQVGHIGEFLPYMTSIVQLGPRGVASTHMPKINDLETTQLRNIAPNILKNIKLGRSFAEGNVPTLDGKTCDAKLKQKVQECRKNAGIEYSCIE